MQGLFYIYVTELQSCQWSWTWRFRVVGHAGVGQLTELQTCSLRVIGSDPGVGSYSTLKVVTH